MGLNPAFFAVLIRCPFDVDDSERMSDGATCDGITGDAGRKRVSLRFEDAGGIEVGKKVGGSNLDNNEDCIG